MYTVCRIYSQWFTEVEVLCFLELVFFLSHEGLNIEEWREVGLSALPCVPSGYNLHSCVFHGIDSEGRWGSVIPWHMWNLAARPLPGDDRKGISIVEFKALHFLRKKACGWNRCHYWFWSQGERGFGHNSQATSQMRPRSTHRAWRSILREASG